MGLKRRERAMGGGILEKGKSDEWMEVPRMERAMCGWECREGNRRGAIGSVEQRKGDQWMAE